MRRTLTLEHFFFLMLAGYGWRPRVPELQLIYIFL
jgi:hypothetical protein